jgi:uncharacterized 2Fe-2S/4Fe-4S cluster protein (DUF4445 family)
LVWVSGGFSPVSDAEAALLARRDTTAGPDGFVPRLACLCRVTGDGEARFQGAAGGEPRMAVKHRRIQGDTAIGVAVDMGTTTLAAALYVPGERAPVAEVHAFSRQSSFGADVLSRIDYANTNGLSAPRDALVGQLTEMIAELLAGAGLAPTALGRLVMTGNTTMLHFLTGLDPRGLGAAPFTPVSLFGTARPAAALFPLLGPGAELYLPPCVSAYVGADLLCGVLATGLCDTRRPALLADVGTNGEMALSVEGALLCCATAAGPAFEGAGIAMGMPARPGAVSQVVWADGQLRCVTVGGGTPTGLCGSGLLSAVALLGRLGALEASGRLLADGHPLAAHIRPRDGQPALWLTDRVVLTQGDIRALQLAKAAVAAGIDTLLHEAGLAPDALDVLYLAGGFGSGLDPAEAAEVGLFPAALLSRTRAVGNAALNGAALTLFDADARDEAARARGNAREVSLSGSAYFMERYVERMAFDA